MDFVCGIYGYQITHPVELDGLRIVPRTTDNHLAKLWARNLDSYHLTAVLKATSISNDFIFKLETVLSFIERLDVLITSPEEQTGDDHFAQFPSSIPTHRRSNGGGAVISEDTVFPTSRSIFISKALSALQDEKLCEETQFNIMFFKYVETFRQRKPFIEVTYFLLYSGLESYARAMYEDRRPNSSVPICRLLIKYGFDVSQELKSTGDYHKAVATYTSLRNALFHNGEFIGLGKDENGSEIKLQLNDYLFNIWQLVALVILKSVEFDDGHINWNSWLDRQPFK